MLVLKKSHPSQRSVAGRNSRFKGLRLPQEQRLNLKAFEKIQSQARRNAAAWTPGQYVGLFQGKVVAVSSNFEVVERELYHAQSDRLRGMIFRVGDDYNKPMKTL